jgi:hypothetical protein
MAMRNVFSKKSELFVLITQLNFKLQVVKFYTTYAQMFEIKYGIENHVASLGW